MPNPEKIQVDTYDNIPIYFVLASRVFEAEVNGRKSGSTNLDTVRREVENYLNQAKMAALNWTKVLAFFHDNEDNASVNWSCDVGWMTVYAEKRNNAMGWDKNAKITVYSVLYTTSDPSKGFIVHYNSIASKPETPIALELPYKTTFATYSDYESSGKDTLDVLDKIRDVAYDLNHLYSLEDALETARKYNII